MVYFLNKLIVGRAIVLAKEVRVKLRAW